MLTILKVCHVQAQTASGIFRTQQWMEMVFEVVGATTFKSLIYFSVGLLTVETAVVEVIVRIKRPKPWAAGRPLRLSEKDENSRLAFLVITTEFCNLVSRRQQVEPVGEFNAQHCRHLVELYRNGKLEFVVTFCARMKSNAVSVEVNITVFTASWLESRKPPSGFGRLVQWRWLECINRSH